MLEALVVLVVAFGLFVVLPLLLLKLLFSLVLFVVLLPFKILGGVLHVLVKLFWGLGKLVLGGLGLTIRVGSAETRTAADRRVSPHPSPIRGEVATAFVFTANFLQERNTWCISECRKFAVETKGKRDPAQSVTDAG